MTYTVFGYGSLIFKPPPHVIYEAHGFLKGYVRRFAQKSHDHRGTPEKPGRVVTLIHKEEWDVFSGSDAFPDEDVVWGIAYTIDPKYEKEVREYLGGFILPISMSSDGYTLETVDVWGINSNGQETIVLHGVFGCFVGRNDNPSFIGFEPLDTLAQNIWESVGPSGPNKEYLYKLVEAVRKLAPESHDSHLYALEVRVADFTVAWSEAYIEV
ncbi:ChaC-like protein [Lentinula lateritia]|uniref:ChaC-like protein n=1 Tax=Lentinula aff. lateritia TaxID=2804960 RepID=A0ACC1TJX1_9AGAR|nr:ChaC-like protein [Lentinula aff. lateritia]KAJ3850916.1 ChaC-like protein [Lentinula lateritia]